MELLESGSAPSEHGVEPGGEGNGDKTCDRGGVNQFAEGALPWFLQAGETPNLGGIPVMEADVAGMHSIAVLEDVEVGDKAVIVLIAFGGVGGAFDECGDSIFEFSNGASKPHDL